MNPLTHPMGAGGGDICRLSHASSGHPGTPALLCCGVGAANNIGRRRQGTMLLEISMRQTAEVGKAHDAILQYR